MPSDAAHKYIAARIRELARRKKWNQSQVADFSGISHAQLSRILHLQQSPTVQTLTKIAAALGVSLKELVPP